MAITTPRLRLTLLLEGDADELFPVLDDPEVHRYIGGFPLSREALAAQLARWQLRASPDGTQVWLNWLVRVAATGAPIGYVQATLAGGCALIAYVIGTAHSGNGYATEASAAMCDALRADYRAQTIVAHIHPDNAASQRVARRLGLSPTGASDGDGEEVWARCDVSSLGVTSYGAGSNQGSEAPPNLAPRSRVRRNAP
jgi:RimJ/RimL family protein N-acetyltransferase